MNMHTVTKVVCSFVRFRAPFSNRSSASGSNFLLSHVTPGSFLIGGVLHVVEFVLDLGFQILGLGLHVDNVDDTVPMVSSRNQ
jgi:hypothetical protein